MLAAGFVVSCAVWLPLRLREWRAGGSLRDAARPWAAPLAGIVAVGFAYWAILAVL